MAIVFENFSFTHLGASRPALDGINLTFEEGSLTAVVGPVGAGKSTMLLSLNGLVPDQIPGPTSGRVLVDELDTQQVPTTELARRINLVFDDPALQIVALTVEEDVAFGPGNLGVPRPELVERVQQALAQTRLSGYERRNPRSLSGGEQQLLAIAGILAMHPKYVAMDEPIAMLDPLGKRLVLDAIRDLHRRLGLTLIITDSGSDIEPLCELVDRMVLLDRGRVVADAPPGRLFAQQDLIRRVGLQVPQVTRLFWAVDPDRNPTVPTTVDEAAAVLASPRAAGVSGGARSAPLEETAGHPAPADPVPEDQTPAIHVKNVHHVFRSQPPVHALRGIDLTVMPGEVVALLGQNGSGKTTLAYHLVGILKPTNPDAVVRVQGIDVPATPVKKVIQHVNYVFQNPANQLFCDTVREEVAYGPTRLGLGATAVATRVDQALHQVGLESLRDDVMVGLSRSSETLIALASVLSMDPEVLIADEPTGGLDHPASQRVMEVLMDLSRQGRTLVIITHDMELAARYATRVVVLRQGRVLLDGTPREVFSKPEVLATARLAPPQVTRLAQALADPGIPADCLTEEELAEALAGPPARTPRAARQG